ncbi:hypothetical protein HDU80_009822 [Chytriomyces hyalinus]|nr:hypothetical protein HDU80_009822 [Chytriomyces hyalinus]
MTIAFNLTLGNVVANPTFNSHMYYASSGTNSSVIVKYNNTLGAFVIGKIPDIMDVSKIDPNHPSYPQLSVSAETGYFKADFKGEVVYSFNKPVSDGNSNGPYTAALEFDSRFRIRDASQEPIYTFPGPRPPVTALDSNKLNFIGTGERLVDPNSQYWITVNEYGQLMSNNLATWNDPSVVAADSVLKLEATGALNMYNAYGDLIKTFFQDKNAIPSTNYFLTLTSNGALLLKDVSEKTLWSLDTTSPNANVEYRQIVSFDNGLCLDAASQMVPCDKSKQSQMWLLDNNGLLRNQAGGCLTSKLTTQACTSDFWTYEHNSLVLNNFCLTSLLKLATCDESQRAQEWNFNSKFGSPLTFFAINNSGFSKQFVVSNSKLSNGVACAGDDGVFSQSCYTVTSSWQYVNNVIMNKNMQCLNYDLHVVPCDMVARDIMWTLIPQEVVAITNPVHIYSTKDQCIAVDWMYTINNLVSPGAVTCEYSSAGTRCAAPTSPPSTVPCPFNTCIAPAGQQDPNRVWSINLRAYMKKGCDQTTFWQLDGTRLRYSVNPAWCLARDLSLQICSSNSDAWNFINGALKINNGACLQPNTVLMETGPNCDPVWSMTSPIPMKVDSHTLYNYATGANMGKWFWLGNILAFDDGKPFYANPDDSFPMRKCAIDAQLTLGTKNCFTGFVNDFPNVEAPAARLVYTASQPNIGSRSYNPLYMVYQTGLCVSAGLQKVANCKDLFAFVDNRLFAQANPAYCVAMHPTTYAALWVPCYKQNAWLSFNPDKSIRASNKNFVLDFKGGLGASAYFYLAGDGMSSYTQAYSLKLSDVYMSTFPISLKNIAKGNFLRPDMKWDTDNSYRWLFNPWTSNILVKDDFSKCLTRQGGAGSDIVYANCGSSDNQIWHLDTTYNMLCNPENTLCMDDNFSTKLTVYTRDIHNINQMITYANDVPVIPSDVPFGPVVFAGGNAFNDWLDFNGWDAQGNGNTKHGQKFAIWNGQMHFQGNPAWCVSGVDNNNWTPTVLKPCAQATKNVRQDGPNIRFGENYCLDLWAGGENGLAHLRNCIPGSANQLWILLNSTSV